MITGRHRRSPLLATALLGALALSAACGGNYSNEDVDFQLALPESDDLTVKLPQALVVAGAAEYYLATREVVVRANAFVIAVTRLVDTIRAFPPSERQGNLRSWGPFPHERDPSFELRLVVTRDDQNSAALVFDYRIEFRRVGASSLGWKPLIVGEFTPTGGTRLGSGAIHLVLVEARGQGYPVADFNELEDLQIDYQRRVAPFTTTMKLRNVAGAMNPGATYTYAEDVDRAGEMTFVLQVRDTPLVPAVELRTRWLATGAGRGDARVPEGLPAVTSLRGIDCWGPDTRPTYVRRDWERREEGNVSTCALPAPPP